MKWDKNSEFTIIWAKEGEILQQDSAICHSKSFKEIKEEEKDIH